MVNTRFPIYTHGYSIRIALEPSHMEGFRLLQRLGWPGKGWDRSSPTGGDRWSLRGGVWLTGTKPNPLSHLGLFNSRHRLYLYQLEITELADGWVMSRVLSVRV